MLNFKKLLILSTCLCLNLSFFANASQSISEESSFHWENINGNWYYKDQNGNTKTGRFCDEYGDIYDTGNNIDGSILVSTKNEVQETIDHNGRVINICSLNKPEWYGYAVDYENGKPVYFKTAQEFIDFSDYYIYQYNLNAQEIPYSASLDEQTNMYLFKETPFTDYDRELVVEKIKEKYGTLEGNNDYEKLLNVCQKLSSMNGNDSLITLPMIDALEQNQGCCWHFAKIANQLLTDAGIYNEVVVGKYQSGNHAWIRAKIDNKWVYSDPTLFKINNDIYWNIDYDFYLQNYRTVDMTSHSIN